jgi:hypothetical protein
VLVVAKRLVAYFLLLVIPAGVALGLLAGLTAILGAGVGNWSGRDVGWSRICEDEVALTATFPIVACVVLVVVFTGSFLRNGILEELFEVECRVGCKQGGSIP